MKTALTHRPAKTADLGLLAKWNHQLIRDEGHRNRMTVPQLKARMRGWLKSGEYQAAVFLAGSKTVAYALYKEEKDEIYLRQLFVRRDQRSRGLGRAAMSILINEIWPMKRLTVEVMSNNPRAMQFYRGLGYRDYCLKMEILPAP